MRTSASTSEPVDQSLRVGVTTKPEGTKRSQEKKKSRFV